MENFNYNQFTPLEWRVLQGLAVDLAATCPTVNGLCYYLDIPPAELDQALRRLKKMGYVIVGSGFLVGEVFTIPSTREKEVKDLVLAYEHSLALDTAFNMKSYGGSFVKSLGELILHADPSNLAKLKATFSEYFNEYHPNKWSAKNG